MAKQVTLRIPRNKGRFKIYVGSALVAIAAFAMFYSLITGKFRSSPDSVGQVTCEEGSLEILRSGALLSMSAGIVKSFLPTDSISLNSGRTTVVFESGDILKLSGKGFLKIHTAGEGRVEYRIEGLHLDAYFDKPDRTVQFGFLHVFPFPESVLLLNQEDGGIRVRCRHGTVEVGLPNGGGVRLQSNRASDDGFHEARFRLLENGTVEIDTRILQRDNGITVEVRDTGAKHVLYDTGKANLLPGGLLEILREGVRAPITVEAAPPSKAKPLVNSGEYETVPAAPAEDPDPTPPAEVEPAPAEVVKPDPTPPVELEPAPAEVVKPDPTPPAEVEPAPAEVVKPDPTPPAEVEPAPAEVVKPDPTPPPPTPAKEPLANQPKPVKGKDRTPAPSAPQDPKPPKTASETPPAPQKTKPLKPAQIRPPRRAPAPPPLARQELVVYGKTGGVTILRKGRKIRMPCGRFPLRSGDVIRVHRGCFARVNIGSGVVVSVYERTAFKMP
jgi:hypothetical protein